MDQSQEAGRLAASLAHSGDAARDAGQIADAVATALHAIDAALAPVIGQRGVGALAGRSLHMAGKSHPWLLAALEGEPMAIDPALLASVLRAQTAADAAAGAGAVLHTLRELLASLVGAALTERLLRTVWIPFSSAPPAQDTSP